MAAVFLLLEILRDAHSSPCSVGTCTFQEVVAASQPVKAPIFPMLVMSERAFGRGALPEVTSAASVLPALQLHPLLRSA